MDAKTKLLRDAGVLTLATTIAMGVTGGALAAKKPDPMNGLSKAKRTHVGLSHNFLHTMPHNFPRIGNGT